MYADKLLNNEEIVLLLPSSRSCDVLNNDIAEDNGKILKNPYWQGKTLPARLLSDLYLCIRVGTTFSYLFIYLFC